MNELELAQANLQAARVIAGIVVARGKQAWVEWRHRRRPPANIDLDPIGVATLQQALSETFRQRS